MIAIALAFVLRSGGGGSTSPRIQDYPAVGNALGATALPGAPEAHDLFRVVPQNGLVLGSRAAPVVMELFVDAQCPFCRDYEVQYLPTIVRKYIRPGQVQLHLQPLAFVGPQSVSGRQASIAASLQDKGFEFGSVLFANQGQENTGWLTRAMLAQVAASVTGLDRDRWSMALDGAETQRIADRADKRAARAQIGGTPTVLVGRTGGKLVDIVARGYAPDLTGTERALDAALAGAR